METKPRVNGSMLSDKIGQEIVAVGKVITNDGKSMKLELSDGSNVLVSFVDVMEAMPNSMVEVNARVNDARTLSGLALVVLSDDFDLKIYNEAVSFAARYDMFENKTAAA
ncbi:uncharacterized protein LOC134824973 [Bolinopsis microptera]|uniref:uncharacterized protein LOC134824973 n=1 Tax=Bolinopsis microptera TaxID=2820187 RepID=UPI00307A12B4